MRPPFLIFLLFISLNIYAQNSLKFYHEAKSLNIQGDSLYSLINYDLALKKYLAAVSSIKKTDSLKFETEILNNAGVMYDYLGNYPEALKVYLEALEICERESFLKQKAISYNNIGALYFFRAKYQEALAYYEMSLHVELLTDNQLGIAQSYENIGIIYKKFNEFDKAESYYLDALEIYKNLNYDKGVSNLLGNLGILKYTQGNYNEALKFHEETLSIQEKNNDLDGQVFTHNNMADVYFAQKQYSNAEKYYKKGLHLAQKINFKDQVKYSYKALSEVYSKKSDSKNALLHFQKYTAIKDSIFNETKNRQFQELQTKFETEKKEKTIAQQELIIKKNRFILNTIIGGSIAGFIFTSILFVLFYQKKKAYKSLLALNVELANSTQDTDKIIFEKTLKYKKSSLTDDVRDKLLKKIDLYFKNEKPYLEKQFTIFDMAESLETNKKYISRIINENYNTNFNNFINKFRVIHARKLILNVDNKNITLEGIADLSGFGTRATFISAFKKFTGVTPSYFLENNTSFD